MIEKIVTDCESGYQAWKAASDSLWSTGAVLLHSVLPTERISELRAGLGLACCNSVCLVQVRQCDHVPNLK